MSNEKYEYTRSLLVLGNLAIAFWIIIAALSVWFFNAVGGWLFLFFTLGAVFLILRILGCSTCAYCKSCTMGFGRLSAWFFGQRSSKDLSNKTGLAFVALIYCLLGPLAAGALTISIIVAFAVTKVLVLACLMAISIYSALTWLKTPQLTSTRAPLP